MRIEIILRIYEGVTLFLRVISGMLLIYALMTWFVRPENRFYRLIARFCDPLLAPFRGLSRKLIQRGLMIDVSVWLALLSLRLIEYLLARLLPMILY